MRAIFIAFAALLLLHTLSANAAELIDQYVAVLSARDHFNSKGKRLTSAAAIIRQDRANYHKFGLRDQGDAGDSFFADADNRATLEKMLERGTSTKSAINSVVNGTPVILVQIFRSESGLPFINVSVMN